MFADPVLTVPPPMAALPEQPRRDMSLATARLLGTTRRDWHASGVARLTPHGPAATVPPSLIADAGEIEIRLLEIRRMSAPKGYRPGNSQAKGPHRIGLSGE
jgi:hypothetical protein